MTNTTSKYIRGSRHNKRDMSPIIRALINSGKLQNEEIYYASCIMQELFHHTGKVKNNPNDITIKGLLTYWPAEDLAGVQNTILTLYAEGIIIRKDNALFIHPKIYLDRNTIETQKPMIDVQNLMDQQQELFRLLEEDEEDEMC